MTDRMVEHSVVKGMSEEERMAALMRVSVKDKGQLKRFLEQSGRRWLVLDSLQLVDALPWPDGVSAFVQVIAALRDHRAAIPTGDFEEQTHPVTGDKYRAPRMHGEDLEVAELDRAIRFLIGKITERDASWDLSNPPM